MPRPPIRAAAAWGILGFAALLSQAIVRLLPLALEPLRAGQLTPLQWSLYVGSVVGNAYAEGYRGFQLQAAPRIVARALYLGEHPTPLRVLLAPFFCTGLFHASRRRLVASWLLYLGIVAVVVLVRHIAQPWRGIIDAGVVVGLTWGLIAILWFYGRALAGRPPDASPDLPDR